MIFANSFLELTKGDDSQISIDAFDVSTTGPGRYEAVYRPHLGRSLEPEGRRPFPGHGVLHTGRSHKVASQ